METTTKQKAEAAGMKSLTRGYELPRQQWMLDNVIADMEKRNTPFLLVQTNAGIELWKTPAPCISE